MSDLQLLLALFAAALAVDLIGFVRTVWFVSLGYTASIAVFVVLLVALRGFEMSPVAWCLNAAALVWALRLGGYLFVRERNALYRDAVRDQTDASDALSLPTRVAIWVGVSVLYVCMFAPMVFVAAASPVVGGARWVLLGGAALMWLGVALEGLADHQKSALKRADPGGFAHERLFAVVRYPNYLGEILVWTGALVACAPVLDAWWQLVVAAVGWVCIVLIMLGSAKRLEAKQLERYGDRPEFVRYTRTVPVLFPGVPLYSLARVRFTLG